MRASITSVCLTLLYLSSLVAGTASAATWTVQEIKSPKGATGAQLYGVSCSSSEFCTGVGAFSTAAGKLELAELWNGKEWSARVTKTSPGSELLGVSCPSEWCMGVGYLNGIEMTARTVYWTKSGATGEYPNVPVPEGAKNPKLLGVSCIATESCIAVGSYLNKEGEARTLTERLNGKKWALLESPNPAEAQSATLASVSCVSIEWCNASGYYNKKGTLEESFVEHWNGTEWSLQALPKLAFNSMFGVSCKTTEACVGVGFIKSEPMSERWNGKEWTFNLTPAPKGAKASVLRGVSCVLPASCMATGHYLDSLGDELTLGEQWNGKEWTIQATKNPEGKSLSLDGVSCVGIESCIAVGHYVNGAGTEVAFSEKYS
jgi:hypothetical protein